MPKKSVAKRIVAAIRNLAAKNGGKVTPEEVVEAARPKSSPLHKRFTWDDTEAAVRWRLHEARNLINITLTIVDACPTPVRAFVSLTTERGEGYRPIENVLSVDVLRRQLLEDAYRDMRAFTNKYKVLKEVAAISSEMEKVLAVPLGDRLKRAAG